MHADHPHADYVTSPPSIRTKPGWAVPAVVFLLLTWLGGLAYLAFQFVGVGFEQWSSSYGGDEDGRARTESLSDRADLLLVLFAVVLAAGPVLIAMVATIGRMRRTAIGFGIAAVPLVVLGLIVGALVTRDRARDSARPTRALRRAQRWRHPLPRRLTAVERWSARLATSPGRPTILGYEQVFRGQPGAAYQCWNR